MNNVIIRKATEEDKSSVIKNQVLSQDAEASLHKSRRSGAEIAGLAWNLINERGGIIIVAEIDNQIIGHIGGAHAFDANPFFLPDWQSHAMIFDLFVLPEYRRQKIGAKLVTEMLNFLKNSGAKNVRIIGLAANLSALELYAKIGFKPYEITLEMPL